MLYSSAATGFRLPSFNSRPLQPDQVQQVAGDQTLAYELGVKSDLFDRKLRVDADVFYTDYQTRPTGVSGQEYRDRSGWQPGRRRADDSAADQWSPRVPQLV